jgi:DNA-binding MarR family transcriptional regulator
MRRSVSNALSLYPTPTPPSPAARWLTLADQLACSARLLWERIGQEAEPFGLNDTQISLLWSCLDCPLDGVSQSQLADVLRISPAHVSGLVEQLRRKGLLQGRRPTTDRRRQLWQLTPQGQTVLNTLLERLASWSTQLDAHLDRHDLGQLLALLAQVLRTLHQTQDIARPGLSPSGQGGDR